MTPLHPLKSEDIMARYMQNVNGLSDAYVIGLYEKLQRDPVVHPEDTTRATVPLGRGFATWQRFHPGETLIWVDDMEGRPKALTPKQYAVYQLAVEAMTGPMLTMRMMAQRLGFSTSTVSRALTKLSAWGILAYIVGRGRYAGLVIIRRAKGDGLDRFRRAARDRVRRWKEAADRRVSRLESNVALYFHERGKGTVTDSLYYYVSGIGMNATLTAQPFTQVDMDELDRELGL